MTEDWITISKARYASLVADQPDATPLALTTSQAAKALGVCQGTIRRWSDTGQLKSIRTPGNQRRFSEESLNAFLQSKAAQTT